MAGERNIEDEIVNDIMSNTGDDLGLEQNNEIQPDEGQQENTTRNRPDGTQTDQAKEQERLARQPNKDVVKDTGKDQPKAPKRDAKGNLVDDNGKVIAASGAERRFADTIERQKAVLQDRDRTIQGLREQLADRNMLNGLPAQHGLDARDVGEAIRVAAMMKRNPIEGARAAIAFALTQGANLQQIVNDEMIPNISLDATRRLLDERLGPIARREQSTQQSERVVADARNDTNQFMLDYPDAAEHVNDIADMIKEIGQEYAKRGRTVDGYTAATIALQKIQAFAIENKLDPRKAIAPQIEAIRAAHANGSPTGDASRTQQPRRPRQPMPNGSGSPQRSLRDTVYANPNANTRDIVREAMLESGFNLT